MGGQLVRIDSDSVGTRINSIPLGFLVHVVIESYLFMTLYCVILEICYVAIWKKCYVLQPFVRCKKWPVLERSITKLGLQLMIPNMRAGQTPNCLWLKPCPIHHASVQGSVSTLGSRTAR